MNLARIKKTGLEVLSGICSSFPVRVLLNRKSIGTDSLRVKAQEQNKYYTYGSAETVEFDSPVCLHEPPIELTDLVGVKSGSQPFVAELRDARLFGPDGVTVNNKGKFILENALGDKWLLSKSILSAMRNGEPPVRRIGQYDNTFDTAVSLVGPWSRGYFHWFAEYLPRLEGVNQYAAETGREPIVLVPPDPPGWMRDSLRLVGYPNPQWSEWRGGRTGVDRLIIPSIRYLRSSSESGFTNSIDSYRWVRSEILSRVDLPDTPSERVLLSRSDADRRRIINEKEVLRALEPRGFERYVPGQMPLEEQIRLFARADMIVAPHGAGLVNTIYSEEATVIELFGKYVNGCYFTMADGLGLNYACLLCADIGSNIRVDINALTTTIDEYL
jgi:hypothetical protein